MTLIPEFFEMAFAVKIILSPFNFCALIALGLCVAIVWRWFKRRS